MLLNHSIFETGIQCMNVIVITSEEYFYSDWERISSIPSYAPAIPGLQDAFSKGLRHLDTRDLNVHTSDGQRVLEIQLI